ncbi:MAG TPA: RNA polymerase sigma factor [Jiangellaceae bacterium]|nr:RNA polymerase sigma factor [Jiangellaceae bacterium]
MLREQFAETLARALSCDEGAFALIYSDVQPALLRYSQAHTSGHAEDITADVWLEVTRALHRFEGTEQGFRAWIFAIARNKIIDQARYDARRPTILLEDAGEINGHDARDIAEDYEDDEATRQALALVRTLPRAQADVILLRVVAGLDPTQVARLLGKTPGAIRVLSHRGLRRLAGILTEQMAVEGIG